MIKNFGYGAGFMFKNITLNSQLFFSGFKASGFLFLCLCALSFLIIPTDVHAAVNKKYASIVIDSDTGIVLHERYADKRLHPASLTKIMTLLMAFEALEQGKMNHNTRIRISRHAASMVPSKLGLQPGSSIKVKDAISSLVTKSANDVAVAMAEHIGGSEKGFAKLMTHKARAIGMKNTTFRNSSGLHHPRQISTARDMAILGQYVINAYPEYYRYFSRRSFTYKGKTYRNHNRLMSSYKGMDGIKTGFINASGFNLVASAMRNNRRIVGVVFGGRSGKTRNAHMASLLDKGFGRVNKLRVASARVPLPPRKPGVLTAVASLQGNGHNGGAMPQARDPAPNIRLASMGQLIGEGDYDLDKIKRIETGLIAISAHTGRDLKPETLKPNLQPASYSPLGLSPSRSSGSSSWAIQIGAFASRAATDQILLNSLNNLPREFAKASPSIAPLRTKDGWLFRGRLGGFTRAEALSACAYFRECLTIAPQNN